MVEIVSVLDEMSLTVLWWNSHKIAMKSSVFTW